jgi:hypothetical protein
MKIRVQDVASRRLLHPSAAEKAGSLSYMCPGAGNSTRIIGISWAAGDGDLVLPADTRGVMSRCKERRKKRVS